MYDIVIIGAGPAGLTAAIYGRRAEKKVLVIEKSNFGGQIASSPRVENYPGFVDISGVELADRLMEQTITQGAMIELDEVVGIEKGEGHFTVKGKAGEYEGKTVIIASGAEHRKLGIEGEARLTGSGVSYCAVCDGAFYKGKKVAVIGGGNTALVDAVLLSDSCEKVYLVQNLPFLTGESRLQRILAERENVEIILSTVITKIVGGDSLRAIETENSESGDRRVLAVEGMFVCVGHAPENEPFRSVASLDGQGYIESGEDCVPKGAPEGIFVAGDCRTKSIRQVTTATSDGAIAALAAVKFLDTRE